MRYDVLPGLVYLVLAVRSDHSGEWVMHCRARWHLDQGFGLQFVERGGGYWGDFLGVLILIFMAL